MGTDVGESCPRRLILLCRRGFVPCRRAHGAGAFSGVHGRRLSPAGGKATLDTEQEHEKACRPSFLVSQTLRDPKNDEIQGEKNDPSVPNPRLRPSEFEQNAEYSTSWDQTACAQEEHEDGGGVCACRLDKLHTCRTNRSLGRSFWPTALPTWQRRRRPGWHDRRNGRGTPGTVEADGAVDVYPPGSNGDVAPVASFTQGMSGPFVVIFDPSGNLWAANVNNNTLVEFSRAELATPNPVPAVTVSSAAGALAATRLYGFRPVGQPLGHR